MRTILITFLVTSLVCVVIAQRSKTENLPKILIIGDSISIGYTPFVKEILKDQAIVEHHEGNARFTSNGLEKLDSWLGETKWDVIQFNFGLHDLCYRIYDAEGNTKKDKENGKLTTSLEQYEKNLDKLVTRLNKTGAQLIWAHTTFVPEGESGRFAGDEIKYNNVATKVMKKHGIPINDLYAQTSKFSTDLFRSPGNVHYTDEGSRKIAQKVADKIIAVLEK